MKQIFLKNVSINLNNNILIINVEENPIIENIKILNGIKSKKLKKFNLKNLKLKNQDHHYNEIF